MFNIVKKEINWAGKKLTLETGKIARQADGAVVATYAGTTVLCAVTAAKKAKEGVDFFPLTVNYQEKQFAAGKIPGGYFKREGKPSEKEVLTSRLIDRPIRPMFNENFRNDTQVVCTVLSYDGENDSDIPALIATTAALAISGVPILEPIAASKVGIINGELVLNPTMQQLEESALDLVVAGTASSVLMVESEAKELSEQKMLEAVMFGHKGFQPVIELIKEFEKEAGKPKWQVNAPDTSAIKKRVEELAKDAFASAYAEKQKQARVEKVGAVKDMVHEKLAAELGEEKYDEIIVSDILSALESSLVRFNILDNKKRIDGRDEKTIRPIVAEVGLFERTHGTALFTRGETQALVVATLGSGDDEQMIDSLAGDITQHFMLHYNFPPYSVGESTQLRPPGRREIGHGKLAWRAVNPLLPSKEEFPYTLRVVSEITESNGSSSMATVCGASLALMDAGVPLKRPVAGIAMGLIKEGSKFAVLSDIMGDEDHLGDMDFKVAGTVNGVTALQMDIKINGITEEIMKIALDQANTGRMHILDKMSEALGSARDSVSEKAPRILTMTVPKDKIREVIGSGGKVIRDICERTETKVDIDDTGTVKIAGPNNEACEKAKVIIEGIIAEAENGKIYTGKVVSIVDFGAFVNFLGAKDGLLHISEIAAHRVNKVTDVLKEGDEVKVKVIGIERGGKVKLSMKVVDQATGADISDQFPPSEKRNNDNFEGEGRDRKKRKFNN